MSGEGKRTSGLATEPDTTAGAAASADSATRKKADAAKGDAARGDKPRADSQSDADRGGNANSLRGDGLVGADSASDRGDDNADAHRAGKASSAGGPKGGARPDEPARVDSASDANRAGKASGPKGGARPDEPARVDSASDANHAGKASSAGGPKGGARPDEPARAGSPTDADRAAKASSAGGPKGAARSDEPARAGSPSDANRAGKASSSGDDKPTSASVSPRNASAVIGSPGARLGAWMRERMGGGDRAPSTVPGVSFAYAFGWTLVLLFLVEAITGAALAAFYSPSSTDAWASVAYVQDRMPGGWFVRGLHVHAASALVIGAGLHLLQAAVFGAYKRPREITWWLGVLLLLLVLGFTITGFVLRWDQAGFWANQVEVGIAGGTPVIGGLMRRILIGGNEYGNLTLTRFYMLHVVLLPALVTAITIGHIVLARRHGATPHWNREAAAPVARWPGQTFRNVLVMVFALGLVIAYTIHTHGADLAAPADPSAAFDARPLWYFRWLYALRTIAGSAEEIVALLAPAVVVGLLVLLPVLDRKQVRDPRKRLVWVGATVALFVVIGALTATSFLHDRKDQTLAKRQHEADMKAGRARALAVEHGVPVTGASDVFTTVPMYRARTLWAQRCADCHDADKRHAKDAERGGHSDFEKDPKGPVIGPGHGSRVWIRGFLSGPSSDAYYGITKLAHTDDAMKPVELPTSELDDLVEALYAESGMLDVDVAMRDRGRAVFDKACTDCHSLDEGVAGGSGPGLGGLNSRDYFTSFIGNAKAAIHMGKDHSQMPRFDRDLSIVDRDALAEYMMWLRTATPGDLAKLGPL